VQLKSLLDEEMQRRVELIALAIDSRDLLQKMADQISADGVKPTFTFLSDPGHKVVDRYGLLNPNGQGWPHPTTYIVDRNGVVQWKVTDVDYHIRPTNQALRAALARVEAARD